jgi:hypothetical protein
VSRIRQRVNCGHGNPSVQEGAHYAIVRKQILDIYVQLNSSSVATLGEAWCFTTAYD